MGFLPLVVCRVPRSYAPASTRGSGPEQSRRRLLTPDDFADLADVETKVIRRLAEKEDYRPASEDPGIRDRNCGPEL